MNISLTSSTASAAHDNTGGHVRERVAVHQLDAALRSGDVDAAKTAYAKATRNVPPAVLASPKSAIGQVGRALKAGDVDAAKKAMVDVAVNVHQYREAKAAPVPAAPVSTEPVDPVSTSGGSVGSLLSVVA